MKKRIVLIVVILLAVLFVGVPVYFGSPKVTARNAIAGVVGDLFDRNELKPLAEISQKGSLSVSAEVDTGAMYEPIYGDRYIGEDLDLSFNGKLYFGKNSMLLKDASLELDGFSMQADLYVGRQYAYLDSDLTGCAVGMIKGKMTDALKSSELAREMPVELYRELLPLMKEYDGISEEKSSKELLAEHLTDLLSVFEKNADYQSETQEILLQGEPTKCRVITVTLDGEGIRAVLHRLSQALDDEGLCRIIDRNAWLLSELLVPENVKADSLSSYLSERIDAEINALNGDENWTLEIATPRFSSKLLSLQLLDGEKRIFSLNCQAEGIQKSDYITICVTDSTYIYSTANHADGVRGASLYRELDRGVYPLFFLSIDEQNDSFCLFWRDGGAERYLMGDWIETKRSTTVIAEKFTDDKGNWIDEGFRVELIFTKKDSMPRALGKKEVRNVFDLTFDEAWEIITKSRGLWEKFL